MQVKIIAFSFIIIKQKKYFIPKYETNSLMKQKPEWPIPS